MKLAYIISTLNPGGAERQTVHIIKQMVRRGHDVLTLLVNGPGNMAMTWLPDLTASGSAIINLQHEFDKPAAITASLKKFKPQAAHILGYPLTLIGALAAHVAKVPHIVIRYENTGIIRDMCLQPEDYEREAHQCASFIVGNSHAVAKTFTFPGISPEQIRVVPNGVDQYAMNKALRKQGREQYGSPSPVIVGHLANFRADGVKNQVMLVRAMDRLRDQNIIALLCGYTSDYQKIVEREIKRCGLQGTCFIPGQLPDLSSLSTWDIAVNTSTTEGFSNAIMECMAHSLPIVATNVGGNPELVWHSHTGYLVDSDDDEALAERIRLLADNSTLRRRMGKQAQLAMRELYNWDRIAAMWEALYR